MTEILYRANLLFEPKCCWGDFYYISENLIVVFFITFFNEHWYLICARGGTNHGLPIAKFSARFINLLLGVDLLLGTLLSGTLKRSQYSESLYNLN